MRLGTLLFYSSVSGNFYYMAHVESVLACFVALIEWQGRRRPWVLGIAFGIAFLARPTVVLAAVPFGIALARDSEQRVARMATFVAPIATAITIAGLHNLARFGSPLETGYATALLVPELAARREVGVFSLAHVPYNLYLFVAHGFEWSPQPPFIFPDLNGHSVLLTSPALLLAVNAARRDGPVVILAAASVLVAIPLFLYYGGGVQQYGYRYALDFMPFLLALVAVACGRRLDDLRTRSDRAQHLLGRVRGALGGRLVALTARVDRPGFGSHRRQNISQGRLKGDRGPPTSEVFQASRIPRSPAADRCGGGRGR